MSRQKGRRGRALRNDRRVFRSIREALSGAPVPLVFRTHHNRKYGTREFLGCMARAAATNRTLAAAARRMRRDRGGNHPTPEWFRECLARAVDGQAEDILAASASEQMGILVKAGSMLGKRLVAVDLHDIARWDRRPGTRLVRSRRKNGTQYFERVMTAQCFEGGLRVTIAMVPVGALDRMPDVLRRLIGVVKRACAGAGVEPVLPVDRGFPSVSVLRVLREERVHYCMMARRTDGVVRANNERAAGTRGRASTATMRSGAASESYTAVIVPRRDADARQGAPPRERFVVFAVSAPWAGVEWYDMRWGIESWYRELERARIRTSTTNPAGRALCMAYSLIMLNAWAVAAAMAILDAAASRVAIRAARITHSEFCDVAEGMADRDRILPKPPPEPP